MYIYLCNIKENKDKLEELKSNYGKKTISHNLMLAAFKDYSRKVNLAYDASFIEDISIKTDAKGKPFFFLLNEEKAAAFPDVHFSISHSGDWWSCILSNVNVGLDIEERRKIVKYQAIAKRFFTTKEYEYILEHGEESFLQTWVRKEAYLKYTGKGLSGGLASFTVLDKGEWSDKVILDYGEEAFIIPLQLKDELIGACCVKDGMTIKEVVMNFLE